MFGKIFQEELFRLINFKSGLANVGESSERCVCDCVIVLQWVLQWLATMIFQTLTPNRNSSRTRSQVRFHRYSISRTLVWLYACTQRLRLNSHTIIRFADFQKSFLVWINMHFLHLITTPCTSKKKVCQFKNYGSYDFRNLTNELILKQNN